MAISTRVASRLVAFVFGVAALAVPTVLMADRSSASLTADTCSWSSSVTSAAVSNLSAVPITFQASGEITPDGAGGGSGFIFVQATGPAHRVWGDWTVQNATGQSIANGNFSAGNCYPSVHIPWSGSGSASNGTLRVIVSGGVSAQDSIPCEIEGQSQDGLEVSSQYGSATCPYTPQ
jgi:hypothetical protein